MLVICEEQFYILMTVPEEYLTYIICLHFMTRGVCYFMKCRKLNTCQIFGETFKNCFKPHETKTINKIQSQREACTKNNLLVHNRSLKLIFIQVHDYTIFKYHSTAYCLSQNCRSLENCRMVGVKTHCLIAKFSLSHGNEKGDCQISVCNLIAWVEKSNSLLLVRFWL